MTEESEKAPPEPPEPAAGNLSRLEALLAENDTPFSRADSTGCNPPRTIVCTPPGTIICAGNTCVSTVVIVAME
ncbi:hypothetical protein ACFV1L_35130 [Kitasatospora sp. NPDC059646]|uniref:hypothetical protein n=1 Tax=Kitasatospora sp. NPDC059646 TaxID=3346893 RepID=UPI0036A18921